MHQHRRLFERICSLENLIACRQGGPARQANETARSSLPGRLREGGSRGCTTSFGPARTGTIDPTTLQLVPALCAGTALRSSPTRPLATATTSPPSGQSQSLATAR